jgi:transcriptional regulator with XRE-family HTH domain
MRTPLKKHPNRRHLLISRRAFVGIEQQQLAQAVGNVRASNGKRVHLTQPDVSHIENGMRTPTHEEAERIASVLNSDPVELFPDLYTGTTKSVPAGMEERP